MRLQLQHAKSELEQQRTARIQIRGGKIFRVNRMLKPSAWVLLLALKGTSFMFRQPTRFSLLYRLVPFSFAGDLYDEVQPAKLPGRRRATRVITSWQRWLPGLLLLK